MLLWEEYQATHPQGFAYSWFCERYRTWAGKLDVVMRQTHRAGEKLFVDYAGQTLEVIDRATGEGCAAQIFVAVLGASNYTFSEATWTQALPDWIGSHVRAFQFLGGVPEIVVPDNLKSAVSRAHRYEPDLNPTYRELTNHYGVAIVSTRMRRLRDKGKIERMVPYVRRLYEAHGAFVSLEESQHYLDRKLRLANQRSHGTTRRHPIEDLVIEREHLRALPPTAYEIEEIATATVRRDGHVRFTNRYYSVDERYIGQEVFVLGGTERIAIYHRGKLIETHQRLSDPYRSKQTKPEHLKPWERALSDHSAYRQRARKLGPAVEELVVVLLSQGQGFIDTRKVWGILSLDKQYPAPAIDSACRQALDMRSYSYRTVVHLLKHAACARPKDSAAHPAPSHKFTRDLAVYSAQLSLFPTPTKGE